MIIEHVRVLILSIVNIFLFFSMYLYTSITPMRILSQLKKEKKTF